MSVLDERIAEVATLLDHLMLLRSITALGSCNDCGIEKVCQVKPRIGEPVRYNCVFWTEIMAREADIVRGEEDETN